MAIYSLNVLMAGTTGSGKSTILNMMIKNVAEDSDPGYMVLLDPKKLELEEWHHHPRCLWYADTVEDCVDVLLRVNDLMWLRYDRAKAKGLKASDEPNVFVFIDEMTMLMQSKGKKELAKIMGDLCIMGRAARIHLVMCAQNCTQQYIPAIIGFSSVNVTESGSETGSLSVLTGRTESALWTERECLRDGRIEASCNITDGSCGSTDVS